MNVDIHAHVVPRPYLERARRGDGPGVRVETDRGGAEILSVTGGGPTGPVAQRLALGPGYYDATARLRDMDAASIDVHVLSPVQFLFHYWVTARPGRRSSAATPPRS